MIHLFVQELFLDFWLTSTKFVSVLNLAKYEKIGPKAKIVLKLWFEGVWHVLDNYQVIRWNVQEINKWDSSTWLHPLPRLVFCILYLTEGEYVVWIIKREERDLEGEGFAWKTWINFVKNIISAKVERLTIFFPFPFPSLLNKQDALSPYPFRSLSLSLPFFSLLIFYPNIV